MKVRVRGIKLPIEHQKDDIKTAAAKKLSLNLGDIKEITLVKKAIDARRKQVYFTYTVDIEVCKADKIPAKLFKSPEVSIVEEEKPARIEPGDQLLPLSPVIIGSGPAGLFCALFLAQNGYKPVVIERGQDVDRRVKTVDKFWQEGILNPNSNTQFGEGGAGTFSDGKLTTRIGDKRIEYVLKTFVEYGADEEILYLKKPHIGTDIIRETVKQMRKQIITLGGEFYFDARLTDISINKRCLKSIIINYEHEMPCSLTVLAVGNSARDVYRMLNRKGVEIIPKAFAVGLRVEHPQELIDKIQYGEYAGHPLLGAADYHLTYQDEETGRSLYTFCMCPGGYVIGAGSEPGQVVTNGMSYYARDNGIANSALVVTVSPADWENTPLGGIKLQETLESRAFKIGGGSYRAPAQRLVDFLDKKPSLSLKGTLATFTPGVTPANLWDLLPQEICEVMRRGIISWDKKMPGFVTDKAVLTGVETRTSAPLRIVRDENLCSLSVENLYPCGEGAGYAGGIISAAVDGLRVAEQIIKTYQRPLSQPKLESAEVVKGSDL